MRRLQLISQGSLSRMIQSADEAWERGDAEQCFETLERATRLDPANPKMQFYLAQRFGLRYNHAAAGNCFEKAIRVSPNKTEALAIAGRLSFDFGNHQMAEDYFRRAVASNDTPAEIFARLAQLYERLNRIEEAILQADQALQLDANCVVAKLTRAKLYRRTNELEAAEQLLHSTLLQGDRDTRVRSGYELGLILDLQGRYDEAMTAFIGAKALLHPYASEHLARRKVIQEGLKTMRAELTADTLHRWFDFGKLSSLAPRRLALLGGNPRSGTTLLGQVLDANPDVVSAEETTIFYENAYSPLQRDLPKNVSALLAFETATAGMLHAARERYFQFMELFLNQPVGSRLLLEKNPSLTFFIPVLIRIFPEMKFLVALRDPRDVVLSCFMLPMVPINQTASAYLNLENTIEEYSILMSIWQTAASMMKNPCLEVRYEDMVEDLESIARKALEFLGIPWNEGVLRFNEHARQKTVRSPTYADVAKPIYKSSVGRWRNYQKYLEPHLNKLEPFVKAFGYE